MDGFEKRQNPRLQYTVPVKFWSKSKPEVMYKGHLYNMSAGGCMLYTPSSLSDLSEVVIEIYMKEFNFLAEAIVIRKNDSVKLDGLAVQFIHVTPYVKKCIAAIIDEEIQRS